MLGLPVPSVIGHTILGELHAMLGETLSYFQLRKQHLWEQVIEGQKQAWSDDVVGESVVGGGVLGQRAGWVVVNS